MPILMLYEHQYHPAVAAHELLSLPVLASTAASLHNSLYNTVNAVPTLANASQ
jgi:hypothetical protein